MDTEQFCRLRVKSGLSQATVAEALGLPVRTIVAWEAASPLRDLTRAEASAARALFQSPVLGERLGDMCDRTAQDTYSEMIQIWLVEEDKCILLPAAVRQHEIGKPFPERARKQVDTEEKRLALIWRSLTTYPLRSGQSLNLPRSRIVDHPEKRFRGTPASHYSEHHKLESLLHVPAFAQSPAGPRPVLLLSLQNKLSEEGEIIGAEEGQTEPIYTRDDLEHAKQLAEEFRDSLLDDMVDLGMLGDIH